MVFIEWWIIQRFLFIVLATAIALFAFWKVEKRSLPAKIAVRVLSTPVVILGILVLPLQWSALGGLSYSAPVFSPDRSRAARIRTADYGATGGESAVELFSLHGFRSDDVFYGAWKSVDLADLHWTGNSSLTIVYRGELESCAGTRSVRVTCTRKK